MSIRRLFSLAFLSASASLVLSAQSPTDSATTAHARRLAHEAIIVDGHIDLPLRLAEKWEDITVPGGDDFDEPRARTGGLSAPFMSVYLPPEDEPKGIAAEHAEKLIDIVNRMVTTWPDKFALAVSTKDVRANKAKGLISLCMGMENGAPLAGKIGNIRHFYGRGIRYITLCHVKDNHICDSSGDTTHTWKGLSPFGRTVVAEMNRIGMMIDVSHLSDDSFYQVMELSKAPVIASHSACRAFTPGLMRNMSDDMIHLLGSKGGVIMVNFGSEFVTERFHQWEDERLAAVHAFMEEHHSTSHDSTTRAFVRQWRKDHPPAFADVRDVAVAIDHAVKLTSIDNVGFGSDFEGLGDQLPTGLKDVSMYPNLIAELLKMGYSDGDIKKICGENLLRVWDEVAQKASDLQEGK